MELSDRTPAPWILKGSMYGKLHKFLFLEGGRFKVTTPIGQMSGAWTPTPQARQFSYQTT